MEVDSLGAAMVITEGPIEMGWNHAWAPIRHLESSKLELDGHNRVCPSREQCVHGLTGY